MNWVQVYIFFTHQGLGGKHKHASVETGRGNWQWHLTLYKYNLQNWKGEIKFTAQRTRVADSEIEKLGENGVNPTETMNTE